MFDIWLNSAQKKALPDLFIHLGNTPSRVTERQMFLRPISWRLVDPLQSHLLLLFTIAWNLQIMICATYYLVNMLFINIFLEPAIKLDTSCDSPLKK